MQTKKVTQKPNKLQRDFKFRIIKDGLGKGMNNYFEYCSKTIQQQRKIQNCGSYFNLYDCKNVWGSMQCQHCENRLLCNELDGCKNMIKNRQEDENVVLFAIMLFRGFRESYDHYTKSQMYVNEGCTPGDHVGVFEAKCLKIARKQISKDSEIPANEQEQDDYELCATESEESGNE